MSIFPDFNDNQLLAIKNNYKKLLIIAGAGTGKTTVIIHRVAYLLKQSYPPESILIITFSHNTSIEIKKK